MMSGLASLPMAERLTLRPINPRRALVSVRLPHVNLASIWATRDFAGRVRLDPPRVAGSGGQDYPAFALQPGFREQMEDAVAALWRRVDEDGGQ
jgi:hypothetical protein